MKTQAKPEDITVEELQEVLKKTGERVQAINKANGIAVTVLEGNQVVKIYPDGRREILEAQVPPPVKATKKHFLLD